MRLFLKVFAGLALAAVLAVATVPWWLGGALRRWGGGQGLAFARYERIGFGGFRLEDVTFSGDGFAVTADRIEAPQPIALLWARWRDRPYAIEVGPWAVDIAGGPAEERDADDGGWSRTVARLGETIDALGAWIPRMTAASGRVSVADRELTLEEAEWNDGELQVRGLAFASFRADLRLAPTADGDGVALAVDSESTGAQLELSGEAQMLRGELRWLGQIARIEADFGVEGWIPERALLNADDWTVPGNRLGVGGTYAEVRGSVRAEWDGERFLASGAIDGRPVTDAGVPPLALTFEGGGSADRVTIETLDLSMPGAEAHLSAPVNIEFNRGWSGVASRFDLQADLESLPWTGWSGSIAGAAELTPVESGLPTATATLVLRDAGREPWGFYSAEIEAAFEWPRLTVSRAEVALPDASQVILSGGWDFAGQALVDGRASGEVAGSVLARWLPENFGIARAEFSGSAEGAWPNLVHRGSASLEELVVPSMRPMSVAVDWRGEFTRVEIEELVATAGESSVRLSGSANPSELGIATLDWKGPGDRALSLQSPATARWSGGQVQVDALRLSGGGTELALAASLGAANRFSVEATALDSDWFGDWMNMPGPPWTLTSGEANGEWRDGSLDFQVDGAARVGVGANREAVVRILVNGDDSGINLDELSAAEGGVTIVHARGRIPVVIRPGSAESAVGMAPGGELSLQASSEPHPEFWAGVGELTGVRLEDPVIAAELNGTLGNPRGSLRLSTRVLRLAAPAVSRPVPEIRDLSVAMTGNGDGLRLERLTATVEGQPVRASGQLRASPDQWAGLTDSPWEFLRERGSFQAEIPETDLAVLARHFPEYLAPAGSATARLEYSPGGDINGFIRLSGASSRPLEGFGVVQDIEADLRFSGRTLQARSFRARLGGELVEMTGSVEWPADRDRRFDVSLRGENLPFVRNAGLLIRGDVDLRIRTGDTGAVRITGTSRLRDSLFLTDVRDLVPTGGGTVAPRQRPPYFSVEASPFDRWQLDVQVQGERFLRLRTPILTGLATARFRLGGTLGEPRAVGELVVEDGTVRLPFASFEVQQAQVRLTEANPYEPQLSLTGTARRFDYELRMELQGTVSNPSLRFTSSPPLDSEEVLLLVMAGIPPGQSDRYSAGQRAVRIGAYLGSGLLSQIGGNVVEPDRIRFSSGERISQQGRETYQLEYRLNPRWSLVGEYDEFDEYNAGVKWRFAAREEDDEKNP